MTKAKVSLGRRLFYEPALSVVEADSCASCHRQELAFTDGLAKAEGVTGDLHRRSSMSLINVAYNRTYTWASREIQTLEQQILIPLFSTEPVELGLTGREDVVLKKLSSNPTYVAGFSDGFPDERAPVSIENVVKALAAFVRTIIAANSPFDRRVFLDEKEAMNKSARRGMDLFFSDRLGCSSCHAGKNFTGVDAAVPQPREFEEFHNTGLYNVGDRNAYPAIDRGLRDESGLAGDDGKFRAPSLRNIAVTAPYMHDGSIATLPEVIRHYAAGGRKITTGPHTGDGRSNSRKSVELQGFEIDANEQRDLLEFLASLTDESVLVDRRLSNPFN